jgi:peptidoglycan hydrolase-like protein with peptidoglycan-binding domain
MENLPLLGLGSRGQDVAALQQFLSSQGMQIAVDGDFGPQTQRAVAEFQQRAGIPVDGTVGPQTYGAIAQAAGQGQQQASPQPRPRPQSVVNPAPRQQQASTSAPVTPVQQGGPLPPALGPAQGPIRQGAAQGPGRQSPEPYGPSVPQIAMAQVAPPQQDMWSMPGNANNGRRPQQSANTFPVTGGQQNQPYPGIEGLMANPSMSWPPPGPSMGGPQAMPVGGMPQVPNMGVLPQGGRSYAPQGGPPGLSPQQFDQRCAPPPGGPPGPPGISPEQFDRRFNPNPQIATAETGGQPDPSQAAKFIGRLGRLIPVPTPLTDRNIDDVMRFLGNLVGAR